MKRKITTNCTALGMSDMSKVLRMERASTAGVVFTAVGLILTVVSYATNKTGTFWLLAEEDDMEGRAAIHKAYQETRAKWPEEK